MSQIKTEGFSLIEMLVALAIVALATAAILSTPFATRREVSAELAAKQIAAALNAASVRAVASGKTVSAQINVDDRTLSVEGRSLMKLPPDCKLTLRTGLELLENEHSGSLLFLADGSSSGGEIALVPRSGRSILIRINWATGAINASRLE